MMAEAVRLMLLGVKLFKVGHTISSVFEAELEELRECWLFRSVDGLVVNSVNSTKHPFSVVVED
jgi:hypothetical protein